jgi:hypothetical protein
MNFQDLPEELILKVLSYSEPKDLIASGQVSKRFRKISHDNSLWQRVNLSKKIVKTEFLEMILDKGCKSLNLSESIFVGGLSLHQKSQLRDLDLSGLEENIEVPEEILASCSSLEKLVIGNELTPEMAASICLNGKTLQLLDLSGAIGDHSSYLQIIKCCQELKEVDLKDCESFQYSCLSDNELEFVAKNIAKDVVKLNLSTLGQFFY